MCVDPDKVLVFRKLIHILLGRDQQQEKEKSVCVLSRTVSSGSDPMARLLCPWALPGKNAGAGAISSSRGLPDPGIELASPVLPALAGGSFHCVTWEAPHISKRYQAVISKIEGCESKCIDTDFRVWVRNPV